MRDDIVDRLRVATVADTTTTLYKVMGDAADEIERWRTNAFFFQEVAHQYWKDAPEDDNSYATRLYEIYDKRGKVPRTDEEKIAWLKEDELTEDGFEIEHGDFYERQTSWDNRD